MKSTERRGPAAGRGKVAGGFEEGNCVGMGWRRRGLIKFKGKKVVIMGTCHVIRGFVHRAHVSRLYGVWIW